MSDTAIPKTEFHALTFRLPDDVYEDLRAKAYKEHRPMNEILVEVLRGYFVDRSGASAATRKHELPGGGALHVKHLTEEELAANAPCTHPRGKLSALGNGRYMCRDCRTVISPTHPERL